MAPSIWMDRSGRWRGNTSASIEAKRPSGAAGYWASTAWLPMITMSRSPTMPLAARIMCSSSARFILLENGQALGGSKNAAEGAGLAQAPRALIGALEQIQNAFERPAIQNLLPFKQHRRRGLRTL